MSEPVLDERYLNWLYALVGKENVRSPQRTHYTLLKHLYTTEFIWFIPNDDNRAEDGRALRWEFFDEKPDLPMTDAWMDLGCSVLEMLVGLARRLEFEAGGHSEDWFWHLLRTLGVAAFSDNKQYPREKVQDILDRLIWRTYHSDGHGGLFPQGAFDTNEDQREVEIWYQMSTWLLHNS